MKNSNLTVNEKIKDAEERIGDYPEKMLARGLNQPFNISNSGSRKLLASSQSDQAVPISKPEVPIVGTGFENRYGDLSSSIIQAEGDYIVLKIIDKYSFKPKHHYYTIVYDKTNNIYRCFETCKAKHITEQHGYHYNTQYMDSLSEGDIVPCGTIMRKSTSYDEYGNRMDGANIRCAYVGTEKNTEDSVMVVDEVCDILGTTHNKTIGFIINSNDRLLFLYGDYKIFPDIGEDVKHNIFCSIRKANKDEELYTLSTTKLKEPLMSDDKIIISQTVIDINVRTNDPERLNEPYNRQLKKYHDENLRVNNELVEFCHNILAENPKAVFDNALQQMYFIGKQILSGDEYVNDGKKFNNIYIDIMVEEKVSLGIGDKVADRYGGKGVVSAIIPKELAMRTLDGEIIGIYINQSTCVNRLNPGQLMETSLTNASEKINKHIVKYKLPAEEAIVIILDFLEIVSPLQYQYMKDYVDQIKCKEGLLEEFVKSILKDEFIYLSLRPIQDNMTEDKLAQIYEKFPWIQQEYLDVPIVDSNGNIRRVPSRRKAIAAKKYMYRLEQYSEAKFSATSLSPTNIKNLNTKSKSYKKYKSRHSNTPITMGNMESDDISSVGQEFVISYLMLHSVSPKGRRLMKKALTGDPFGLDIRLDEDSSNRNVEILNAYQKTKGTRLVFNKIRKKVTQLVSKIPFIKYPKQLVRRVTDNEEEMMKAAKAALDAQLNNKNLVSAILVQEISEEEYEKLRKDINK